MRILLVDDEKDFVQTLSERLINRNIDSTIAYDGEQALSMVAAQAPQVMVVDVNMPGMDGLEVLRRVKKSWPATEVIILTGHGSKADESAALALSAFAYLSKPVDIDVLVQALKEAYSNRTSDRMEPVE